MIESDRCRPRLEKMERCFETDVAMRVCLVSLPAERLLEHLNARPPTCMVWCAKGADKHPKADGQSTPLFGSQARLPDQWPEVTQLLVVVSFA